MPQRAVGQCRESDVIEVWLSRSRSALKIALASWFAAPVRLPLVLIPPWSVRTLAASHHCQCQMPSTNRAVPLGCGELDVDRRLRRRAVVAVVQAANLWRRDHAPG
jgi:hypothetical protein